MWTTHRRLHQCTSDIGEEIRRDIDQIHCTSIGFGRSGILQQKMKWTIFLFVAMFCFSSCVGKEVSLPGAIEEDIIGPNGNVVATVIKFSEEGFQISKPTDNNECRIGALTGNHTCFEERLAPDDLPQVILKFCEGRDKPVLVIPIACTGQEDINEATHKRETMDECCRWTFTNDECLRTKCCKRFLGLWCTKRCCAEYSKIWSKSCVTGYVSGPDEGTEE